MEERPDQVSFPPGRLLTGQRNSNCLENIVLELRRKMVSEKSVFSGEFERTSKEKLREEAD